MVSKETLKGYEFNSIEEYYDYIVQSEVNGQRRQVRELISKLSKQQKKEAIDYIQQHYEVYDSINTDILLHDDALTVSNIILEQI